MTNLSQSLDIYFNVEEAFLNYAWVYLSSCCFSGINMNSFEPLNRYVDGETLRWEDKLHFNAFTFTSLKFQLRNVAFTHKCLHYM